MPDIQIDYKANIPVLVAREDGAIVAYTPALNLGSCGRTQAEALKRLGDAINLFFSELIEMGTLDKALKELGWREAKDRRFVVPRSNEQPAKIQRNIPTHLLGRRSMNIRVPVAA
ncbi:MAG: hypothetical protein HY079_11210 [Elusimicrobia bacterium]|nr:hypothetical protein [Elusimicrobiota bacterium]